MYKILGKEQFSEKVFKFVVSAPLIARSRRAGNFVILRLEEKGERIPLTIADANTDLGTITLVVQAVGVSKNSAPSNRATASLMWWGPWDVPQG